MSPNIGAISNSYRRGWDAIFDFAVYLSKSIQKHLDVADPLSLYSKFTSNEEEPVLTEENIVDDEVNLENMYEEEKENLQEERNKLKDSFENITEDFDQRSKVHEALMSIWSKIIRKSKSIRVLRKAGRKLYKKTIQQFLPFSFDQKTSVLEGEDDGILFDTPQIVEMLNERIKESMRDRVKTVISNRA